MTDIKLILKAIGAWFLGFIIIVLSNWIVPVLQDALDIFFSDTEISSIIWFGAIIIWILAGIVMPITIVYKGLTEEDGQEPLAKAVMGIIIFIFGTVLTIKGWFMVLALRNLAVNLDGTPNGLISAIFWIGLFLTWTLIIIITPYKMITEAYERTGT